MFPLAAALGGAGAAGPLAGQVSLQAAAGVRYTSTMVRDSIVTPVAVRPTLAPALALTAALPLEHRWSAEAILDLSWSTLERHDQGGPTVDLGGLATVALELGLRHPLRWGCSARLALGGLVYRPAAETGIFRAGSGGLFPVAGLALRYAPAFAPARRWGLALEARYDVHAFITRALRDQGFPSARPVHRLALALTTGWPHGGSGEPGEPAP